MLENDEPQSSAVSVGVRGTFTSHAGTSRTRHGTAKSQPAPCRRECVKHHAGHIGPLSWKFSGGWKSNTRALGLFTNRAVDTVRHGSASPSRPLQPAAGFPNTPRCATTSRPGSDALPTCLADANCAREAIRAPTLHLNEQLREYDESDATLFSPVARRAKAARRADRRRRNPRPHQHAAVPFAPLAASLPRPDRRPPRRVGYGSVGIQVHVAVDDHGREQHARPARSARQAGTISSS